MEILAAIDWSSIVGILSVVLKIAYVALGLGLVIFFHELGHFAVAKWCDVNVERFSIGFGPVLFSWKRGETEYVLSALPIGGYVKMLGQDDIDPSQLSSEEIAANPRSYSAKSVPQRMAIISAGVIMNIVTGLLFFAIAFGFGVGNPPSVVGAVQVGMPAWAAGIERGDRITKINGRDVDSFPDIMRGVALSRDAVRIEGVHRDGRVYEALVIPDLTGTRRAIGVGPTLALTLITSKDGKVSPVAPGTPAARANPGFEAGDIIRRIDNTEVTSFAQLQDVLAERRGKALDFHIKRKGTPGSVTVRVEPNNFHTLGVWADIGRIAAIVKGSTADKEGLQPDDRIVRINGKAVGTDIDPIRLPDYFEQWRGKDVLVTVSRPVKGAEPTELTVRLVPGSQPSWLDQPDAPNVPLPVPSIGIAFHLLPSVLKVEPDSPAAKVGIQPGEIIRSMEFAAPKQAPSGGEKDAGDLKIEFGKDSSGRESYNWAYAFWKLQIQPESPVKLTVGSVSGKDREVTVVPAAAKDWYLPIRGIRPELLIETQQATGIADALGKAFTQTRNTVADIYLTLRNLLARTVSYKELRGPLGIASFAYRVASEGIPELVMFLGFLSINLAVLNFLPIPVLDGGHMVFLCWEGIMRRRPSERVLVTATYIGMAFVLGLMLLVLYLDIVVHKLGTS